MKYLLAVCAAVICLVVIVPVAALHAIEGEQEVEASFELFNQQWMDRLYNLELERKSKENLVCKKVQDAFVAEYTGYSKTYRGTTKRTDYKETPYIGILSYQEQTFVSRARTYEEAINGNFTLLQECPVTEIFSFAGGKWRY